MNRVLLLVASSLILLGCVQSPDLTKTTPGCPISGAEIEEMCGVELEEISRSDYYEEDGFASCEYYAKDVDYFYWFGVDDDNPMDDYINATISSLENDSMSYEELDYGDRAIFYEMSLKYSVKEEEIIDVNYTTSYYIVFVKGDKVYSVWAYSNAGEEPEHCVSKEKLLGLADLYVERTSE